MRPFLVGRERSRGGRGLGFVGKESARPSALSAKSAGGGVVAVFAMVEARAWEALGDIL